MPNKSNIIFQFWEELKRRKVFRVIAMYAATAFIIMDTADIMLPRLGLPDWTVTLLIVLLLVGFPIAAVVSWIYDITPEGIQKTKKEETEKAEGLAVWPTRSIFNANNVVIAILIVAVCILLYPKIFNQPAVEPVSLEVSKTNSRIAVLPFKNLIHDPESDHLGFALAVEIIGELVYLNSITVRSSGSVRKYKDRDIDPISVGDSLNVDYVLTGYYLKEDNLVHLNIELVEVNSDSLIWRTLIEVDFSSTIQLQEIVALKVVEGLDIQFTPKERDNLGRDIPANPQAYDFYLRSISYPYSNEGDQIAIKMLKRSIELDSTYAPAYAQLGDRTHRLAQFGLQDPEETSRSENYFLKALSLNKDNIFALANLAMIYTETARIEEAVELTKQILAINPGNAEAHFSLGYIYRYAGMNTESVQEMEKAMAIDPENPGFRSIVITYQFAGELEKSLELSKHFKQSDYILGYQGSALFRMGNEELAIEYFNRCISLNPDGLQALWVSCMKASIEGNIDMGMEAARKFEKVNIVDAEAWYHFAGNYGLLGNKDGCIRALQRAVDGGFFNYPFMLKDSFLDSMREDAEFQQVLERAKKKHFAFRKKFF